MKVPHVITAVPPLGRTLKVAALLRPLAYPCETESVR